jgi:hypothetical protein
MIGTITGVGTNGVIVVNGQRVDISQAEIKTTLMLGQVVKIEGILQTNGRVLAREVEFGAAMTTTKRRFEEGDRTAL